MSVATVAFATLGCRLNQVDSAEMQAALQARGFSTVAADQPADVVVVNTCTVTARAEFSDRQAIHRARRRNPHARVVVTGCWAQTDPGAVTRIAGVDLVTGNADKGRLPAMIERLLASPRATTPAVEVTPIDGTVELPPPPDAPAGQAEPGAHAPRRSRAFVKVQDGCDHRCAFCIVTLARGPSRSRQPQLVLDEVQRLVAEGHPEIVLTGVDLGDYGADLVPRTSLVGLIERMADIRGLRWIRLSSVLPAYFTPALLDVVTASPIVAPHLHVPLQSGSDRILRRMRRPYTVAMYRRLVERLASSISGLGLGADVIVGFPGEGDDDFEATVALVEALPFTYLHVFPYSDRPGTEAAGLDGRVDPHRVTIRSRRLRAIAGAKSLAFRTSLLATEQEALVLETRDRESGKLVGLTGNYVEVLFDGPAALARTLARLRVTAVQGARTEGAVA